MPANPVLQLFPGVRVNSVLPICFSGVFDSTLSAGDFVWANVVQTVHKANQDSAYFLDSLQIQANIDASIFQNAMDLNPLSLDVISNTSGDVLNRAPIQISGLNSDYPIQLWYNSHSLDSNNEDLIQYRINGLINQIPAITLSPVRLFITALVYQVGDQEFLKSVGFYG